MMSEFFEEVQVFAQQEFLGNSLWDWAIAITAAAATAVVGRVLVRWLAGRISHFSTKTTTRIDDAIAGALRSTRAIFFVGLGLIVGAHVLSLPASIDTRLGAAVTVILALQAALWLQMAIVNIVRQARTESDDPQRATLVVGLGFTAKVALWVGVVLLTLQNLGIEISALIAGLGIGGIAAALAVQNVLSDIFSALSIYFDRPFDIGDYIVVGDDMGTVDKIGWRSTRIRALGGQQIVFPNTDLARTRINNYRRMDERRIVFEIGVVYSTATETLEVIPGLIQTAIKDTPDARFDRVHFKSFADSALMFEAVYYVLSGDYGRYMDVQHEINLRIVRSFRERGIEFAFPSRSLYLESVPESIIPARKAS